MSYHQPVMLNECLEGLNIDERGTYVDATFGGGGHSQAILERLTSGKLYAFDQDDDAAKNAEAFEKRSFTFIATNFRNLRKYLRLHGVQQVDGILADLGVSSHQIDEPVRGFSTRFDGPLDMRMDQQSTLTAAEYLNNCEEGALHKVLGIYGEIKNARTAAKAIIQARHKAPIANIAQLLEVIRPLAPRGKEYKYFAQVFQALRIEINDELKALEELLQQSGMVLKPGGRLVVMSYHSLEDRLVKNYIARGKFSGEVEKDFYGNLIRPLQPVNRKPITASAEEIKENGRARSAKLRIAEKI